MIALARNLRTPLAMLPILFAACTSPNPSPWISMHPIPVIELDASPTLPDADAVVSARAISVDLSVANLRLQLKVRGARVTDRPGYSLRTLDADAYSGVKKPPVPGNKSQRSGK